jgi:hypothetical protein
VNVSLSEMAKLAVITAGLTTLLHGLGDKWITVGRTDDNTFQIAETSVSVRHCELLLRDDDLVVVATYDGKWNSVNKEKE